MNYLSYQPAFDVFHTEFRLLRLRRIMTSDTSWHYDQLRIADFYLLFFFRLERARLLRKHRSIKVLARELSKNRYENQPDDYLLFNRMEKIQLAAAGTLVSLGFFEPTMLSSKRVVETGLGEPEPLSQRIEAENSRDDSVMQALQTLMTEYELLGPDGIKARTGLLEFRYDAI
ncbi:hypothetical protein CMZ84_05835 [Lysobacteraceae bacterium NML93-0399]|nr:hypothetical protein CMZ84_05835 [Xanthomonadaceae bacterium NML93-0399]